MDKLLKMKIAAHSKKRKGRREMKKVIFNLLGVAIVLVFCSMAMAGDQVIGYDAAYDARVYHESIGPSTTVGGWKLGVNFKFSTTDPAEMLQWHEDVANREVKFVNIASGDTFSGAPQYCYNTPPDSNCDFNVWFGNRLTVSDNAFNDSPVSAWNVLIDDELKTTMVLPDDSSINLFKFPEISHDKNGMKIVGDQIKIIYSSDVYPTTTLKLIVYDSAFNVAYSQAPMIQGTDLIVYVPISLSGSTARLQMNLTNPPIRKSTFFKLP